MDITYSTAVMPFALRTHLSTLNRSVSSVVRDALLRGDSMMEIRIRAYLIRKGIDPDAIDLKALIDKNLSFEDNIKNIEKALKSELKCP